MSTLSEDLKAKIQARINSGDGLLSSISDASSQKVYEPLRDQVAAARDLHAVSQQSSYRRMNLNRGGAY